MSKYVIEIPFPLSKYKEITITSDNLLYVELCETHAGCQCRNLSKASIIREKCIEVANLIREIEILNK